MDKFDFVKFAYGGLISAFYDWSQVLILAR